MLPVIVYDANPDSCAKLRRFVTEYAAGDGSLVRLFAGTSSDAEADRYLKQNLGISLTLLGVSKAAEKAFELGRRALRCNRDNYTVYLLYTHNQMDALAENCLRPTGIVMYPFEDEKLRRLFQRIEQDYRDLIREDEEEYIVISCGKETHRLSIRKILYLEAAEKKTVIWTERQSLSVRMTMNELEEKLPKEMFLRCHRSFIVNMNRVVGVDYANMVMTLGTGEEVYFSRSYKADVRSMLEGKGVKENGA